MKTLLRLTASFLACAILLSACASRPDAPPYQLPPGLKLSEAVVLRVRVLNIEETGYAPACEGDQERCVIMQQWDRYHAQVLEVVHGQWDGRYADFARLEHGSYVDSITQDCFVILTKLSPVRQEKFHVQHQAFDIVSHDKGEERNIRHLIEG